jgi:hypothetical protein
VGAIFLFVRQVHTRPVQHARLVYIFFYIYIYIYIYTRIYKARMLDRVACEPPYKNPKNIPPNVSYENCSHFWDLFRFRGVEFLDFLESKNIFKPCHHIEFNTQNPNPILKITIPFTKTPTKTKHFRIKRNFSKYFGKFQKNVRKPKFVFCILYTFHNS